MAARKEAGVSAQMLERILKLAGTDMVLVGGQALAFWSAYYQTPTPTIAITKDIDLLGGQADVKRLARGLNASCAFPHRKDITLLAGQVTKGLPDGDYINIDVMLRVYGAVTAQAIKARAVLA